MITGWKVAELNKQYLGEDIVERVKWIASQCLEKIINDVTKEECKSVHFTLQRYVKMEIPNWKQIKKLI